MLYEIYSDNRGIMSTTNQSMQLPIDGCGRSGYGIL